MMFFLAPCFSISLSVSASDQEALRVAAISDCLESSLEVQPPFSLMMMLLSRDFERSRWLLKCLDFQIEFFGCWCKFEADVQG